ncbi:MAG: hypothetical protein ACUVQY_00395 [Thermoproteota archaeon]
MVAYIHYNQLPGTVPLYRFFDPKEEEFCLTTDLNDDQKELRPVKEMVFLDWLDISSWSNNLILSLYIGIMQRIRVRTTFLPQGGSIGQVRQRRGSWICVFGRRRVHRSPLGVLLQTGEGRMINKLHRGIRSMIAKNSQEAPWDSAFWLRYFC